LSHIAPRQAVTRVTLSWLYAILSNIKPSVVTDELISEKLERTERFLRERGGVVSKREWWRNVLGGVKKRVAEEVMQTLAGLGVFRVWRRGRAVYLVAPWFSCCLNCKHLVFDYEEKVYSCLKGHDLVGEMKMDLTKSCRDFEPRGGEE